MVNWLIQGITNFRSMIEDWKLIILFDTMDYTFPISNCIKKDVIKVLMSYWEG